MRLSGSETIHPSQGRSRVLNRAQGVSNKRTPGGPITPHRRQQPKWYVALPAHTSRSSKALAKYFLFAGEMIQSDEQSDSVASSSALRVKYPTQRRTSQLLAPILDEASSDKILNVYNWNAFIEPSVILGFENEFGINIRYHVQETRKASARPRHTVGSLSS